MLKKCSKILLLCRSGTFCRYKSSFRRIVDLKQQDNAVSIKGWIGSIRKMKDNVFVDVIDGSTCHPLQVVMPKTDAPPDLQYGCSVEVTGDLVENKNNQIEMHNSDLKVIGNCELGEGFPFAPKKTYTTDYVRQFLHFRPRYSGMNSLFRIRNEASTAVHTFYREKGYINVHTPILTSNDCEGAGEVFVANKPSRQKSRDSEKQEAKFFDDEVYLTVSGQLHLEVAARGLNQVYCLGPTFRAENSKSRLHLSEFYMLEAETTLLRSMEDLTEAVQELVHYVTHSLFSSCSEDIEKCRKALGHAGLMESTKKVEEDLMSPFPLMTYSEASEILLRNPDKLKTRFAAGKDFTKEQELFLVEHNGNIPVFVVEWPRSLKPFYMKSSESDDSKVMAFDLLCPNVGEVCGGSFREDDYGKLEAALRRHKVIDTLSWYLELRKFGNVTTSGYGLGFERLLLVLLQILNIKDVIPFPRWPHNCKL